MTRATLPPRPPAPAPPYSLDSVFDSVAVRARMALWGPGPYRVETLLNDETLAQIFGARRVNVLSATIATADAHALTALMNAADPS